MAGVVKCGQKHLISWWLFAVGIFMLVDKHNLPPNCCLDKIGFSSLTVWIYSYNSANVWYADMELIALENRNNTFDKIKFYTWCPFINMD